MLRLIDTPEMKKLKEKFSLYFKDDKYGVFREDTPQEILDCYNEYSKLFEEQYNFALSLMK